MLAGPEGRGYHGAIRIMPEKPMTLCALAELVGGIVEGDGAVEIRAVASIDSAGPGELTFATDEKHAAKLGESKAAAAIVAEHPSDAPMPLIRVGDVQAAVAAVLAHFAGPEELPPPGIHAGAVIAEDAKVADGVAIGPGVVVGPRAIIGAKSVLCPNATVGAEAALGRDNVLFEGAAVRWGCRMGDRVRIGPNTVIGFDGFGYYFADGVHHRIPHTGNVVIGNDVDIGACSCVDRAKFGSTRIGDGTKIDNLVQVAHNVQIGKGCILAAFVGIGGSTRIGDYSMIMGHVGIRNNITLGERVTVGAYAAVSRNVPDGQTVMGIPAGPADHERRVLMASKKLPELVKRIKALESKVEALESPENNL